LAGTWSNPVKPGQTGSSPIKSNQVESNQIKPACWSVLHLLTSAATREGVVVVLLPWPCENQTGSRRSRRIKPNQTKSNLLAGLCSASLCPRLREKVLWLCDFCALSGLFPWPCESRRSKANQTKSNLRGCASVLASLAADTKMRGLHEP
jgi:hypothetical protein